jgi:hypothetical protein
LQFVPTGHVHVARNVDRRFDRERVSVTDAT